MQPPKLRTSIITLILLVVVPSLLMMLFTAWEQHKSARDLAQQRIISLVQLVVYEENQLIAGTRQLLMSMAQLQEVQDPATAAQCQSLLNSLLRPHPYYTNFGVAKVDGAIYCSALEKQHEVNISDRLYFKRTMTGKGFGIGEYQVGRITGIPAINFSYPIVNKQGVIRGAVFAAVNLKWLSKIVEDNQLPKGSVLQIIDNQGRILVEYPETTKVSNETTIIDTELYRHIQSRGGKGSTLLVDYDEIHRFYAYSPLVNPEAGIYVAVGIPQKYLTLEVDKDFSRNIIILILLSMLVASLAWVYCHKFFLQRIQMLTRMSEKLQKGILSTRSGLANSKDELGCLAQTFDSMSASLQKHQTDLKLASDALKRNNKALQTLSACNRVLIHTSKLEQLLEMMCRIIVEIGGYPMVWVGGARDDADQTIDILAHAGIDEEYLTQLEYTWPSIAPEDPSRTALSEDRRVISRHSHAVTLIEGAIGGQSYRSLLALPLKLIGQNGVITIYSLEKHAFDEQEVRLLQEMADDIAYGVYNLDNQARHREAEAHIRYLAYHDPLTNLPNRYLLENTLTNMIQKDRQSLAVLMININRFNEINNTIGYHHADDLLKSFGPRLEKVLAEGTFISRTGGDIFAVILPGCDHSTAIRVGRDIQAMSQEPFRLVGLDLDISVSIGIALYPEHGEEPVTLIRRASLGMHTAKHAPNDIFVYDASLDQEGPRRLTLATELRRAIEQDKLQLFLQPKVDLQTDTVVSVEALCRWHHAEYGDISPVEFIPLAEHTGLIAPLTLWVLKAAIEQLHKWFSQGIELPIAVNLSARNLYQQDLVSHITNLCNERGVPVRLLELELTESDLMEDPLLCRETLKSLHGLGIRLYIDDYGTGYSSLSYIKQLPMSAIKIDKSFVIDMQRSMDAVTIVKSTIAMGHELGMQVIAEGVENREIYEDLASAGCDQAQGYYISRPQPCSEFMDWLNQGAWNLADSAEPGNKTSDTQGSERK